MNQSEKFDEALIQSVLADVARRLPIARENHVQDPGRHRLFTLMTQRGRFTGEFHLSQPHAQVKLAPLWIRRRDAEVAGQRVSAIVIDARRVEDHSLVQVILTSPADLAAFTSVLQAGDGHDHQVKVNVQYRLVPVVTLTCETGRERVVVMYSDVADLNAPR